MSEEALDDVLIEDNHGFKEEIEYAGFWIRVGAAIIDTFVFIPIIIIGFYNLFSVKSIFLLFILTLCQNLYKPLMEWRYGATLGKMACNIKVVNQDMKPISIDQSFGRFIPWVISAVITLISSTNMYLSSNFQYLDSFSKLSEFSQDGSSINTISTVYSFLFLIMVCCVAFDSRKRGLHDMIAKTFCIKINK